MKSIAEYKAPKYLESSLYALVEDGIFEYANPPDAILEHPDGIKYQYGLMTTSHPERKYYVASLTFEQEPEFGEGTRPDSISQYPLEYILDTFNIWVSDFYEKENAESKETCYLEFGASKPERLKDLRELIGKHVYSAPSQEGAAPSGITVE